MADQFKIRVEMRQIGSRLNPNMIHTPGIFIQRIFKGEKFEKRIEQRTVRPKNA